ncbi:unnamed protein product [Cochlearia groenlandica]
MNVKFYEKTMFKDINKHVQDKLETSTSKTDASTITIIEIVDSGSDKVQTENVGAEIDKNQGGVFQETESHQEEDSGGDHSDTLDEPERIERLTDYQLARDRTGRVIVHL